MKHTKPQRERWLTLDLTGERPYSSIQLTDGGTPIRITCRDDGALELSMGKRANLTISRALAQAIAIEFLAEAA